MRERATPTVWFAVALILVSGLIHFIDAPDAFSDMVYKGVLFAANGIAALIVAGGLLAGQRWAWWFGLLVAGSTALAYIASRTVGLPGLPAEPDAWFEPLGILSLLAELLFVAVATAQLGGAGRRTTPPLGPSH